jgi:hypothetical protein
VFLFASGDGTVTPVLISSLRKQTTLLLRWQQDSANLHSYVAKKEKKVNLL